MQQHSRAHQHNHELNADALMMMLHDERCLDWTDDVIDMIGTRFEQQRQARNDDTTSVNKPRP